MSTYYNDACAVLEELKDFRDEINDFLPDTPGGNDYAYPWERNDYHIVWQLLSTVIDRILATKFYNHFSFELTAIRSEYYNYMKDGNIEMCQKTLNNAMKELSMVFQVCKQFKKYKKTSPV